MTDFFDQLPYDRHFNYHHKVGAPGDTEHLVSGIERMFTNSLYAKIDSIMSGLNEIDLSGFPIHVDFGNLDNEIDFLSGKLSTMQTQIGAEFKTTDDKIDFMSGKLSLVQTEMGAEFKITDDKVDFASGKLSTMQSQMGADTAYLTQRIEDVILGQVWKDAVEASGSLINDNLDVKLSTMSGRLFDGLDKLTDDINIDLHILSGLMIPDLESRSDYLSGMVGLLPTSAVSLNLTELSGTMVPDIKAVIVEERNELSGLISILPQNHTALRNQVDFVSGKLALVETELGTETKGIDDTLTLLSGMILDINTELDIVAVQTKLDLVSGIVSVIPANHTALRNQVDLVSGLVGVLPGDLTGRSSQVSVNLLSGNVAGLEALAGADTKIITDRIDAIILGQIWADEIEASGSLININLNATVGSRATQTSVDVLSGLVGALPGDLSSRASQDSLNLLSGIASAIPADLSSRASQDSNNLISGMVGILPGKETDISALALEATVDLVSGMIGRLPTAIPTYASQASVNLVSGMIGVLPGNLATRATQTSVDFVSGKLSTLENGIKPFRYTTFVQKVGTQVGLISGKYVTLFTDSAYKDTRIKGFQITDTGALNNEMKIETGTTKLFPYDVGISYVSASEQTLDETVDILSGMNYNLKAYTENTTQSGTLNFIKIIELG